MTNYSRQNGILDDLNSLPAAYRSSGQTLVSGNNSFSRNTAARDRRKRFICLPLGVLERGSRRICHVEAWQNDRCRESVAVSDVMNVQAETAFTSMECWTWVKKMCRAIFNHLSTFYSSILIIWSIIVSVSLHYKIIVIQFLLYFECNVIIVRKLSIMIDFWQ